MEELGLFMAEIGGKIAIVDSPGFWGKTEECCEETWQESGDFRVNVW